MSQEELAFNSVLDRTYISLLERGKRKPTISTLFSLASALNIPPS
ncbi:helix-turn-helix domain-containing protein [Bacillus cereus]